MIQLLGLNDDDSTTAATPIMNATDSDSPVVPAPMSHIEAMLHSPNMAWLWGGLTLASAGASAFHGVRRHRGSIGWGAAWFLAGLCFPIFVPIVSIAQGYGKPIER